MNLQVKLSSLRKQKGLTQLDLAEKLNVSRQAISRWEVGAAVPSMDNLKMLSELYGVSVDSLLNDDSEDACKAIENQAPREQSQKLSRKKLVLIFAVTLAAVTIIVIFMSIIYKSDRPQVIPMEGMETVIKDDYPTETFSIKW